MKKHLLVIAVAMATAIATVGVAQAAPTSNAKGSDRPTAGSASLLSPRQRTAITDQIVRTWGPYVQIVHDTSASAWAKRMHATFAGASNANLRRAAGMKTFQGMMGALTGQNLSDAQVADSLATQAQVLSSSSAAALLGSTTADLVFTPLAPCRIADTRVAGGQISGGSTRNFRAYTASNFAAQGGTAGSNCGIPANPSALMINVAAPFSTTGGYLTVWPYGTTKPLASNLDYKAGDLANNEIAAKMTLGSATAEFSVYAHGTTHVVVDVVGYFMAPVATMLECTRQLQTVQVPANGGFTAASVHCPVGYSATGGGCNSHANLVLQSFRVNATEGPGTTGPVEIDTWFECDWYNPTANIWQGDISVRCCRIPGR